MRIRRSIKVGDICEYEDCVRLATMVVYSRNRDNIIKCCIVHADIVVEETGPEYTDICENCGCMLPIN